MLNAMRTALLLLAISATAAWTQQPDPAQLFQAAAQAQQSGDYSTAISDYQKFLKLEPRVPEAHANLGAALVHEGRFDEGIAQYKLALASMNSSALRMNLALAYYKKGDLEDAHHEFEEVRKSEPDNPQLAILLGDTDVRLNHAADAVAMLTPLEAANASNTDFEYVLANALIHSGHRREGADRMEKVAQTTHSADAYLIAGSTLLDINEFARASADLEAALKLNPNLPHIQSLVGVARDMNGDIAGAEPALREALKRDPNDFDANLYLGSILYKNRAMDEAKPYLDHALQLQPASPTARYEMAMWQSTSGNYAQAAPILEALAKENPNWLQPHVELANVYYRLHRPADGAKERAIVAHSTRNSRTKARPSCPSPSQS